MATEKTTTLLPCPFCGSDDLEVTEHPPHKHLFSGMPDHPGSWTVVCGKCPAGMIESTFESVAAVWNRRDNGSTT